MSVCKHIHKEFHLSDSMLGYKIYKYRIKINVLEHGGLVLEWKDEFWKENFFQEATNSQKSKKINMILACFQSGDDISNSSTSGCVFYSLLKQMCIGLHLHGEFFVNFVVFKLLGAILFLTGDGIICYFVILLHSIL